MKCPKCHYLSFEPEPRCKNCGYDLALGPDDPVSQPLDRGARALADFNLRDPEDALPPKLIEAPLGRTVSQRAEGPDLLIRGSVAAVQDPLPTKEPQPAPRPASRRPPSSDLPLFLRELSDHQALRDEPLVRIPTASRPPLSVRRNTPVPGRIKEKYAQPDSALPRQRGLLDRELIEPAVPVVAPAEAALKAWTETQVDERPPEPATDGDIERASAPRRIEAALIDVLFLGAIDVALIWLTLQRCNLTLAEVGILPILPVLAFLLLINTGYLLLFTATTGQTVGKMAAGIRVIDSSTNAAGNERVTVGQAALRALLTLPSVLALGAGFFPALLGEHRALHDRLTHTRVVRI
jgi:uncharacterized RDD family membrane protein YckC